MKRIIALTSLFFVLLMAVLPAQGLKAAAATNVEITAISMFTDKGEEIKVNGNKNNFHFNLTKYAGDTSIERIEFYSPNAVSLSFVPVDVVLELGENIDDYDVKFVNGVAYLDPQKVVNWYSRNTGEPVEDFPVEDLLFTIQDIRDEFVLNDFNALELYAYDAAGNESVVNIDPKSKGWFYGNGKWYYFNDQLALVKGWLPVGGKWYFFGADNAMYENKWAQSSGKWYYLGQTGAMVTNSWVLDGGKWYYVDANGVMKTGWIFKGGKWYFLDDSGAMKTGWGKVGAKWYFFDQTNGDMKTGWLLDGTTWYFLETSGAMKTGWLYTGGKWYFLQSSGAMKTGWLYTGGKWYYLYSNGSMAANTTIDGYRLGKDGAWIK